MVDGEMKGERAKELSQYFRTLTPQQMDLVHRLVAETVDKTLRLTMCALDSPKIDIIVHLEQGKSTKLREASEDLTLEIYGWVARFSKIRYGPLKGVTYEFPWMDPPE
jgi:hypothetical protein